MDSNVKSNVLRKMTYGLWILATEHKGDREASTVTWLSQVSFTPPLIMVALKVGTHLHQVVEQSGGFALHLVNKDQKDLAGAFTRPTDVKPGTIGGLKYATGPLTGSPILEGFACWLEARVTDTVRRGDHTVFVAEVVDAQQRHAAVEPLVLATTGWSYGG